MGFIDCDAHIWETDATWDHLAASEAHFRPKTEVRVDNYGVRKRFFQGNGWAMTHGDEPRGGVHGEEELAMYPPGTKTLADVPLRLAAMDSYGIDVQILNPTGWTHTTIDDPAEEAALARSYNRWMAQACEPAGGRLRWSIQPSMLDVESTVRDLEWGKANGAACIALVGRPHHTLLTDPKYYPIWEAAESLGLACNIHVGQDQRKNPAPVNINDIIWYVVAPVVGSFYHLMMSDFDVRFPNLQWMFSEAGAGWVPWLIQQASRTAPDLWRVLGSDWKADSTEVLAKRNFWVSAEQDDDLAYVVKHLGADRLTFGSDYGHFDIGSDPEGHRIVMTDGQLDEETARKITDSNARTLFGISPDFRPADALVGA